MTWETSECDDVEQRLQALEIGGVAGSQGGSVADGDRRDHQVSAALAARCSASSGVQFAVDIGFTLGEWQAVGVGRSVLDDFDSGVGGEQRGKVDRILNGVAVMPTGRQFGWQDWLSAGLRAAGKCIPGHSEKGAARGVTANHGSRFSVTGVVAP